MSVANIILVVTYQVLQSQILLVPVLVTHRAGRGDHREPLDVWVEGFKKKSSSLIVSAQWTSHLGPPGRDSVFVYSVWRIR